MALQAACDRGKSLCTLDQTALTAIAQRAGGDIRNAINALQMACETTPAKAVAAGGTHIDASVWADKDTTRTVFAAAESLFARSFPGRGRHGMSGGQQTRETGGRGSADASIDARMDDAFVDYTLTPLFVGCNVARIAHYERTASAEDEKIDACVAAMEDVVAADVFSSAMWQYQDYSLLPYVCCIGAVSAAARTMRGEGRPGSVRRLGRGSLQFPDVLGQQSAANSARRRLEHIVRLGTCCEDKDSGAVFGGTRDGSSAAADHDGGADETEDPNPRQLTASRTGKTTWCGDGMAEVYTRKLTGVRNHGGSFLSIADIRGVAWIVGLWCQAGRVDEASRILMAYGLTPRDMIEVEKASMLRGYDMRPPIYRGKVPKLLEAACNKAATERSDRQSQAAARSSGGSFRKHDAGASRRLYLPTGARVEFETARGFTTDGRCSDISNTQTTGIRDDDESADAAAADILSMDAIRQRLQGGLPPCVLTAVSAEQVFTPLGDGNDDDKAEELPQRTRQTPSAAACGSDAATDPLRVVTKRTATKRRIAPATGKRRASKTSTRSTATLYNWFSKQPAPPP